jgi:hypothetical protein
MATSPTRVQIFENLPSLNAFPGKRFALPIERLTTALNYGSAAEAVERRVKAKVKRTTAASCT